MQCAEMAVQAFELACLCFRFIQATAVMSAAAQHLTEAKYLVTQMIHLAAFLLACLLVTIWLQIACSL